MAAPRLIAEIRQLISDYSFEIGSCQPDDLIAKWVSNYDLTWVHSAIVESLYQGRYKLKSIDQILNLWKRRGHPLRHFNREFESIILGYPSPPSPFLTKDSKPAPSPLTPAPSPAKIPSPPGSPPKAPSSPEHSLSNPPSAASALSPPLQNLEPLTSKPSTSEASTLASAIPETSTPEISTLEVPTLEPLIPEPSQILFPLFPSSHAAEASPTSPHSVLETLLPQCLPLKSLTLESSSSDAFATATIPQKTFLQTPPLAPSVPDSAASGPSNSKMLTENLLSSTSEASSNIPDTPPDPEDSHNASEKEWLETPAAPFNPFFSVLPLASSETVSKTFLEELSEAFAKEIATAYAKVSAKPFSPPPKSTVLEANGVILPFVPHPPKSDLYSRLRAVAMRSQVTS